MNAGEQKQLIDAFKYLNIIKQYKETYGKDWKQVYDEDKENNCLLGE